MTPEKATERSIDTLQRIYAVIAALAMNEALKRTFLDAQGNVAFDYWLLPELVAFVVTVVPFVHGMNRHLDRTLALIGQKKRRPLFTLLLIDFVVFLVESCLLFLLATSVTARSNFFQLLIVLLIVDLVWSFITWPITRSVVLQWALVNVGAAILMWSFITYFPNEYRLAKLWILTSVAVVRTVVDYILAWNFYFPALGDVHQRAAGASPKPPKVYLAGPGVFLRDSEEFGREKRDICEQHGLKAHYPTDNQLPIPTLLQTKGPQGTALEISLNDEKGMDDCDFILADLTPSFSGLTHLGMLVKGDTWDKSTLLKHCSGLQQAFDRYPGLAELMIDFPEAGQLLTGQPDTGTVFELGYVVAKSKRASANRATNCFAYSNSPLDYYTRMLIANGGNLPKRTQGVAANLVEEDVNEMMVDRLDPAMHGNLMLDSPVIRFSGKTVHRPTIDETRQFLQDARRHGRRDGMYRYLGVFNRAVQHAAEVLRGR